MPAAKQLQNFLYPQPHAFMGLTSRGKSSKWLGVEAKEQLTGKSNLPKTCVANSSVEMNPQPDNTIKSSALNNIPEQPNTLPLTHGPTQGTQLPDPAPPASIHGLDLSALNPPIPVRPTTAPLGPTQLASAPLTSPATRPNSITFGPGIA